MTRPDEIEVAREAEVKRQQERMGEGRWAARKRSVRIYPNGVTETRISAILRDSDDDRTGS